ncbi:MAG: hypothetical protein V1766_15575 [Pseudomonadota bacterium]
MIDVPTLFILGAGASKPYGYPLGTELRTEIINNFLMIFSGIINMSPLRERDKNEHLRGAKDFIEHFAKAPVTSIDKYLAFNPSFKYYGKIAITICIVQREMQSTFLDQMEEPFKKQDWYRLLFNRMISTFNGPDDYKKFPENQIAFITFNYDRSLEHFLFSSFQHNFWQQRGKFERTLKDYLPFPIIHVYGQCAQFIQEPISGLRLNTEIDYGETVADFETFKSLSSGIHVVGEERSDNQLQSRIHELIKQYKRIFFLGFGYADENLEALGFQDIIDINWKIYGTAHGMTKKEIEQVRRSLIRNFKSDIPFEMFLNPYVEDKNSHDLLREYL